MGCSVQVCEQKGESDKNSSVIPMTFAVQLTHEKILIFSWVFDTEYIAIKIN